ncbi:MAG: D-aminoacyl-tRNA deacylase [bacterium]|nr:D-aminoacyl-tRNA deacylase [bacterium]
MRACVQRVKEATVTVGNKIIGQIDKGLLILLGITHQDTIKDVQYLVNKIINLRIFTDETNKFNLSVLDINGGVLIISQFTLYGDCRKGRKPDFTQAAAPELARELYLEFIDLVKKAGIKTQEGEFGAKMLVDIHNDGPVTLILDSKND